jgi:hypothetical protein
MASSVRPVYDERMLAYFDAAGPAVAGRVTP